VKNKINISIVTWQEAESSLRHIRTCVFIEEQSVPATLEWDGLDDTCLHILVSDGKNNPVGTARMQPNGHIGRMAVMKDYRHQGIGSAMLELLVTHCKKHKLQPHLDAQVNAIHFYEQHDFKSTSDVFMDAGIPHKHMELK